ncbi:hypothetical protein HZS55_10745 [Halosimplex rubrum]|uniref:Uncharacterized protein n=1 Tax=Halosimplex rubrum TaxID=869889 RepID=A0A7D5T5I4_9EURY|nr:hypothetical protein [Halosimplex rubrum]QLH77749.1 hypothetical protein HZS55_10745 [Halosimplex rubrum]
MATDGANDRDRTFVFMVGAGLVVVLYALGSAFDPSDLVGLVALYGTYLAAFAAVAALIVDVYTSSYDDTYVEAGDDSPAAEWDDVWDVSSVEVATAAGLAALLAVSVRASLALGTVATAVSLVVVLGFSAAAGWWLYVPERGRAAPDDYPFASDIGVMRRQVGIFCNMTVWFTAALMPVLLGWSVPVAAAGRTVTVPALALSAAALLVFALSHWLLTRPLVER